MRSKRFRFMMRRTLTAESFVDMRIDFRILVRMSLLVSGVCAFMGCQDRVDHSSPISVAKYYYSQYSNGDLEEAYSVIADTCKAMVTFDEYVGHVNNHDSVTKKTGKVWFANYVAQPPILDDLKYRRFEVQRISVDNIKNDTLKQVLYCTLLNEAGKWRVVWVDNIYSIAESLREQGRIGESNKTCRKILAFDPYYGAALIHLGWSDYFEFNNYGNSSSWGSHKHNPNLVENQILMAYMYCAKGEINQAGECFQLALELQEKSDRKGITEFLHKSYPPKTPRPYYEYSILGEVRDDGSDVTQRLSGFFGAIDLSMVEADVRGYVNVNWKEDGDDLKQKLRELLVYYTQKRVYAILARCELDRYIVQSQKESLKHRKLDFLLIDAQEHIEFALEIEPDNDSYLRLLGRIKQHIKSLGK